MKLLTGGLEIIHPQGKFIPRKFVHKENSSPENSSPRKIRPDGKT
jgi:hypothetical protein